MIDINQSITWLINEKYGGKMDKMAFADIARLRAGEPVDYVIGYKKFLGCKIDLRYKPLIPRDETEFWVQQVIKEIGTSDVPKLWDIGSPEVLDMFAGSGCIGIAVLKNVLDSHCDFVDIDENCLKQIELNLKINKILKHRYRIIKSDVFHLLSTLGVDSRWYDCIFANPPYINRKDTKKVQKSALFFEPKKALFARDNGLFLIKKFFRQAKGYLAKKGKIYMEFGQSQKIDIERILKKFGYQDYKFYKDQFGKWRYVEITTF